MSNTGQAALTIVGTVVGTYFGYPQLGYVLGSLAGQALFPTQLPGVTGPRLSDLNTTNAEVGGPIVWPFGTIAVPGTVIWLAPVVEHTTTEEVGGKGAEQDVTSFSYTQSIGYGLGEPIESVSRIWENGKLVYDAREQQAGESDADYQARFGASGVYEATFVLYLGTEDELPDPTMELVEGVGNVPGYRGLSKIIYPDRQLRDDQGRRHPNMQFEVNANAVAANTIIYTEDFRWLKPKRLVSIDLFGIGGGGGGQAGRAGHTNGDRPGGQGGGGGGASQVLNIPAASLAAFVDGTVGHGGAGGPFAAGSPFGNPDVLGPAGFNGGDSTFGAFMTAGGGFGGAVPPPNSGRRGSGTLSDGGDGGNGSSFTEPGDDGGDSLYGGAGGGGGGGRNVSGSELAGSGGDGNTSGLPDEIQLGGGGAADLETDGRAGQSSTGTAGGGGGGGGSTTFFNGGAYGGTGGSGGSGGIFGGGGGGGGSCTNLGQSGGGGPGQPGVVMVQQHFESQASILSLADITRLITARCGFADDEIDVADLEDKYVMGYALARPMTGRDALVPLRSVGLFDVVESGRQLKFVKRGKAVVATLSSADLGASESDTEFPPAVSTKMAQDVELPRRLRVHYIAPSRDYGAGEQPSPQRVNTEAVNEVDVELAVALEDDHAAQLAEILWQDAWTGRYSHDTAVDRAWLWLEGGDCISVPVDGEYQRCRIVQSSDASALLRKLSLVRDDDGTYVSQAVADPPGFTPQVLSVNAATRLVLLDLPLLRDEDNNAGIYAAATRIPGTGTTWTGAVVFRSSDGGSSWEQLASTTNEAKVGALSESLAAGITTTWDNATELFVILENEATLESRTDDALLSGNANGLAVGADGRWEIVQFGTAELIDAGTNEWKLTHLLRGRRGTERFVGTGLAGDTVVLISGPGIIRLPLDLASLGQSRVYRSVSVNTPFSGGIDQDFAGHGVALLPFSPVYPTVTRAGGDVLFSAIRRGRIGGELPDGTDIPLSEETESYEVDVHLPGSPDDVIRTLAGASFPITYTEAQQATDFGSPTLAAYAVSFYQRSASVGRSPPLNATL